MPIDATIDVMSDKMTDATIVGILEKMTGVEVPAAAVATGHLEWPTYHLRSS